MIVEKVLGEKVDTRTTGNGIGSEKRKGGPIQTRTDIGRKSHKVHGVAIRSAICKLNRIPKGR